MTHSHLGCKPTEGFDAVTSAFPNLIGFMVSRRRFQRNNHEQCFRRSAVPNLHDLGENVGFMCKHEGPKSSRSHIRTRTPSVQVGVPVDMQIGGSRVQYQRRDGASHTSLGVRYAALMTCQVSDLLPREHFKNNTDEKPTVEVVTGGQIQRRRLQDEETVRCEVGRQLILVA